MKISLFILLATIVTSCCVAQKKSASIITPPYNLVANGTFEDINVCTEFETRCEPEAWFFLPTYIVEPQGNDSNKYEVIAFANATYKSRSGNYIYTKLLCPLQKGKSYRFSMWVVTPKNEFDHLDIHLSYLEPSNHLALNTITEPAFSLTSKNIEGGWHLWKKYGYTYTATGEERFMTIGNFSNKPIQTENVSASNKQGEILYSIDNILLTPFDKKEVRCNEYYAGIKQLYDQNYRHPARMAHNQPIDSSLLLGYNKMAGYPEMGTGNGKNNTKTFTKTDTLVVPDILFRYNSSKINPAFYVKLQALITNIRIRHFSAIEIVGHTDNIGGVDFNDDLSLQRAAAIRSYILSQLPLPQNIIEIKGAGETRPKSTNDTPEGRKNNRRVEIILKQ